MKKIFIAIIALLLVGVGGWYANTKGLLSINSVKESTVIATVNGEEITQDQFDELENQFIAAQGVSTTSLDEDTLVKVKTEITNALISQALLSQAAKSSGLKASSTQADLDIASVKSQFPDDAQFQQALVAQGITEVELRLKVENELLIRAYLEDQLKLSQVTATDAEIKAAYDQVAATQQVPPLTEVREQVKEMVLGQKRQALISAHVAELRADAVVEIM